MPFTLTREFVTSLFEATARGDFQPFISAIDPNVSWWITSNNSHPAYPSGIYNLQQWQENVAAVLFPKLKEGTFIMKLRELHMSGSSTAIVQTEGYAVQNDGEEYCNDWAWFLTFNEETGKIVEIREYMNSALVKEMWLKK